MTVRQPVIDPESSAAPHGVRVALRDLTAPTEIACAARHAVLVVPVRGTLLRGTERIESGAGLAILHHDEAPLRLSGIGAECLVVQFRPEPVNAAASRLLGNGRRLGRTSLVLAPAGLRGVTEQLLATASATDFAGFVARALAARGDVEALLPPVRAVSEAMRIVRDGDPQPIEVERLATMVGVTSQTLRKGFRACLGMTVKEFAAGVRLDWAHGRLASARESRPVAALAQIVGFSDSTHFSRSYARRFGETPSQTRARAVIMAA
jgi:AraC-like DNA-binding protein